MKTSVLISSIAAFCFLAFLSEVPRFTTASSRSTSQSGALNYETANYMTRVSETSTLREVAKNPFASAVNEKKTDFSYLKFDAADYETNEDYASANVLPEPENNNLSLLKFTPARYQTEGSSASIEKEEMPDPKADMGYLKFDPSAYSKISPKDDLPCSE
jgi:hypothetical protein